jgi:hypothetical protein
MNGTVVGKWLCGRRLLGVAVGLMLLLLPTVAVAQDGPQFPSWGPGMSPPDQQGADTTSPGQTAPYGAGNEAAPYAAPAPDAAAPVPIRTNACSYDLRGYWNNDGRQTTGYDRRSYSATVTVSQYGVWIRADQNDGNSYYGQCIGNRVQFDVYNGFQYVGRQYGTITGYRVLTPVPLYPNYGPGPDVYAAPAPSAAAPPPPGGGSGLSVTFTWATYYGSGTETWTR